MITEEIILPSEWLFCNLDEGCVYIQRGKSPIYCEKSSLIVINQKCVRWSGIDYSFIKFISQEQLNSIANERYLQDNDILWNSTGTGTIGRAAIFYNFTQNKYVVDSHITILRVNQSLFLPKYIHFFISSPFVQQKIDSMQSGSTNQVELPSSIIKGTVIPLPPLAEQHRIVARIEELFSSLDKGIEALRTAQQQLKVYRQAVLKYAFEGRLTNPDVKEGELPEGWVEKKLFEVGKWTGGGTPSKANLSFWNNGKFLWVTPKDMKSDNITNTEDKITKQAIEKSSAKMISANSVLIVVRSGILRRTLPVSYVEKDVTVNQDMQAITPYSMNNKPRIVIRNQK
ncbi:MAG: restriction endonuclease subunit S [Saprospiraceae bacterium]